MSRLEYQELSSLLEDWSGISSCSEIHGLVSGLVAVGLGGDFDRLVNIVSKHVEEPDCSENAAEALKLMHQVVLEQLAGSDFDFQTLLPEEDEALFSRVEALAQWCQGFLVGFGTGVKSDQLSFSEEAQEALKDLVEISNVIQESAGESEEDEVALTELEEYVRMAVMMLYSEFVLVDQAGKASEPSEPTTFH